MSTHSTFGLATSRQQKTRQFSIITLSSQETTCTRFFAPFQRELQLKKQATWLRKPNALLKLEHGWLRGRGSLQGVEWCTRNEDFKFEE